MREAETFAATSRWLHWLMAVLILAMLFIGVAMVASATATYSELQSIHRPLGVSILVLAVLRIANRLANRPPPLPATLPEVQKAAAHVSHYVLYGLMVAMPLIGWAMLSAGRLPAVLYGPIRLPPIAPENPALYAGLRTAHGALAYLFFAVILVHIGAALYHGLIRRDGVLESMAGMKR